MDPITILKILIICVFLFVVFLRSIGPTKNKAAIDRSIQLLREHFTQPSDAYSPDPLIYEQFKENCTDPALLTELAYGIIRYCGMEAKNLSVITKTDRQLENAAGTYSSDGVNSLITIRVSPTSRYPIIHSVLIHECMHYFLLHSGIRIDDTYQNEILTDTATVYMGFYEFMYNGYLMVGYLRESELKYIHKRISDTHFTSRP